MTTLHTPIRIPLHPACSGECRRTAVPQRSPQAAAIPPVPPTRKSPVRSDENALPDLRLLSLGAGVQSTTLLYMALRGELPPLDGVLFADTGWEPQAVYRHVETLQALCQQNGLPFHRVQNGHIINDAFALDRRFASLPLFVRNPDGGAGILRRQCTNEYKLVPLRRKVRELLGGKTRSKRVEMWLGISLEEAVWRIKPSRVRYIRHVYPLVEQRMTRHDCIVWLVRHGYAVPRSPPASAAPSTPMRSGGTCMTVHRKNGGRRWTSTGHCATGASAWAKLDLWAKYSYTVRSCRSTR